MNLVTKEMLEEIFWETLLGTEFLTLTFELIVSLKNSHSYKTPKVTAILLVIFTKHTPTYLL